MLTLLFWFIVVLLYLNIGYFFGRVCYRAYHDEKLPEWKLFLLWPFNGALVIAEEILEFYAPIFWLDNEEDYLKAMTLFWPIKIAWNIVTCLLISAFYVIYVVCYFPWELTLIATKPAQCLFHRIRQ